VALGGVVLATGVLALREWERAWRWLGAGLVLALALVAAQDFLRPGITYGHDIPHHSWAIWSLWRCVLDGDWFPRWNPYLSLGIPLLPFYAPLPYMAAWPAQALGASPTQALAWLMVLGQWATGMSLLLTVRWLGGSWLAGLLAAGAAMLAPYHLMDQTFRLALGETMAFPFVAPMVVASWRVARGDRGAAQWVLGLCAAGLLLTHLLTLIMASVLSGVVVGLALSLRRGGTVSRRRGLAMLALTAALTASASASWLLPVVTEMQHTAVSSVSRPGRAISPYAALLDEPVTRRLWPRYDIRRKIGDVDHPGLGMPMYFGWGLLALLGLALARPRREEGDLAADPRLWGALGLGALLLALHPFAMALDGVPLIGRIMFPWRLYAPATVLAALAGGLALDHWAPPGRARALLLTVGLGALAMDVAPYLGAAQRFDDHEGMGLVEFRRSAPVTVEGIPRDRWVRVEGARLPPSDYDWQLALGRRAFPEYMAPKLRRRYGRSSKPPTKEESEFYGASFRIRRGQSEPLVLNPDPMVSLRPTGAEWMGANEAGLTVKPEHLTIALPDGVQAGELRVSFGYFPGWEARVDGGAWRPAGRRSWLLATDIPSGARRVEMRFSATAPWGRSVGILLSLTTLLGLGGTTIRRRTMRAVP
ncbi:MAG: hypothetical protein KDA24_21785, partial [Deltaproteobacteria bacterium]|nr:hypothetical protein [Deltaproteobacteria bacterium]